jgi:hypothetical protein
MVTKVTINEPTQAEVHAHGATLMSAWMPAIGCNGRSPRGYLLGMTDTTGHLSRGKIATEA